MAFFMCEFVGFFFPFFSFFVLVLGQREMCREQMTMKIWLEMMELGVDCYSSIKISDNYY